MASVVAALAAPCDGVLRGSSRAMSFAANSNQHAVTLASTLRRNACPEIFVSGRRQSMRSSYRRSRSLIIRAAKLPAGVEAPLDEPRLPASLWGFTERAEVWNSRAAMIGLFALIALEFLAHKGILQIIGVEVGKGLDLPL